VTDQSRRSDHLPGARAPRLGLVPVASAGPVAGTVTGRRAVAPDGAARAATEQSRPEAELDGQIHRLLDRIAEQERLAEDAQSDLEDFFGWPSWSMDTGLSAAQERFVEHWSPQRVLDDFRAVRRLVRVLQQCSGTHSDDDGVGEALTVLTALHPR
jgi:hypothetical protein